MLHHLPTELILLVCDHLSGGHPDAIDPTDHARTLAPLLLVNKRMNVIVSRRLWRSPYIRREYQLRRLMDVLTTSHQDPRQTTHAYHDMVQRLTFGHFLNRCLTDVHIQLFLKTCTSSLRSLNLGNCIHLTNETLKTIARHCTQLEVFYLEDVYERPRYSVEALCMFVSSCRHLKDAGFYRCPAITDPVLQTMAEHNEHLSKLVLFDCGRFTATGGLQALIDRCLKLDSIIITSRFLSESEAMHELAVRCRRAYITVSSASNDVRIVKHHGDAQHEVERRRHGQQTESIFG